MRTSSHFPWGPALLLALTALARPAQAQLGYSPATVQNVASTYTDLGTTGTAIATPNNDDANSAEQLIGFNFSFDGMVMDRFILNTNGFLKLGAATGMAAPTAALYTAYAQFNDGGTLLGTAASDVELLSPFNYDLADGTSPAEFRLATTGTAPNRVCTVQWKNVADKAQLATAGGAIVANQYANLSFQVRLFETSNMIEFVYGPNTPAPAANNNFKYAQVGLKGTGSATKQIVRVTKASATLWGDPANVFFVNGPVTAGATGAFNFRQAVPPEDGRTFRFSPVVANDAAVNAVQALTQLPIPQGAPHVVRAVVSNNGTTALANLPVTLTVTGANAFTNTQTVPSLAVGASATVSFAGFAPTATGTNTLTVTVPPDGYPANDSRSATQVVNTTTYSYADAGVPSNFFTGYGPPTPANPRNALVARFTTSTAVNVTQVRAYVVNLTGAGYTTTVGETVFGVLMDAGGNVLARSADHVVTAAEINTYVSFPLTTLVSLPAGTDMYVGLAQLYQPGQTATFAALGSQSDGPGRAGAFYASSTISAGAFPPVDLYPTFPYKYMLEAVTAPTTLCPGPTNLAATGITNTGAALTFTAPAGASGYTLTYAANGGPATTVTPAPTGSPVVLASLSPATAYLVTLTTSCGGGQTSVPASFAFTTTQAAAPYASLPVAESFEGPWLSVAGVRDAPATNWRNTPATGVQSWRREDDGASADWPTNGGGFPQGGTLGAHSARFHSYDAPKGTTGALDLYVNLSPAGTKTLSFDYYNPDGTDQLDVLVSTDGGATFSPTPVLTVVGTKSAVLSPSVNIASTSATTVIRFRATSDHGSSDIGLDNLRLGVVLATRNEALAATVGLYPNPAHGAFALAVPAGPLGAASATLRNALGQVVQTRQLRLPAAGGTASFDVRGLAPGVYTLQLFSGETLVVKRVVVE